MIVKFQLHFIMAVILFGFSFVAFSAELHVVPSTGKLGYPVGDYNANGIRTWRTLDGNFVKEYSAKYDRNLFIRDLERKVRSANTVPVVINQKVPKKTVLTNLLKLARVGGGAAVGVGTGPVGWAYNAYTAYTLVEPLLRAEDYVWDNDKKDFVTTKDYVMVIEASDNKQTIMARYGISKDSYKYGYTSYKYAADGLCNKATSLLKHTILDGAFHDYTPNGSLYTGICEVVKNGDERALAIWRIEENRDKVITQSEFDEIIGPQADQSPDRFVNATAYQSGEVPGESEAGVTVLNNTTAQSLPYTNANGQVVQTVWNFTTIINAAGQPETRVTSHDVPRPDLQPDSPQAPSTGGSTGSNPGSNTGGQPGSDGSPGSDGQPKPNPNPNPDPNEKPDEKPQEGFLCSLFPDILACQLMGEPDESIFDDIEIPQAVNDTTWQPDNFLPLNGVCPQPKIFHVVGREFRIDYSPLCSFLENVRFMILLAFTVAAAYISFGGLRSDK